MWHAKPGDQLPHMQMRELVLDKMKVQINGVLDTMPFVRNHLELAVRADDLANALVLELSSYVLGKEGARIDVEERWPADWWQAVRERWLPAWWLRRYPVRYRHLSIHKETWRVCPHVDVTTPKGRCVHFGFLEAMGE